MKKSALFRCVTLMALVLAFLTRPALALRIRDAARISTEVPNELVGMGLVFGLPGTGDGDDYLPAMRPLKELLRNFENPVVLDKELKNSKNVAIVSISMTIPPRGAHNGDRLDVKVSAIAAKNLKGGRLFFVPMYAPTPTKTILASASGDLELDNNNPAKAIIREGGVLIEDILPEEIRNNTFTFILNPDMASWELATAIADQINEDVSPQTNGRWIAYAVDATSVQVTIPESEQHNPAPFIARLRTLPLPTLPDPALVTIIAKDKLITFSDEVEIAPTMISQGNLTITIGAPNNTPGTRAPFVVIDPHGTGNAKLRDLQNAFNMLKVGPDERIAIVRGLKAQGALKAELREK
jgi:flagellar P-ring protein precursor FlgI